MEHAAAFNRIARQRLRSLLLMKSTCLWVEAMEHAELSDEVLEVRKDRKRGAGKDRFSRCVSALQHRSPYVYQLPLLCARETQ